MDDPLSAVDAHVGKKIFKDAIQTQLSDKTVLLNTHHLHFAKCCENIILMDQGRIISSGNYRDLKAKHPEVFEKILKEVEE